MCLRFVFLLAVQIPAWLRLSGRPPTWKDAEILLLRHQLAVLQRQTAARPRLTWTDRALFAALLTLIPRSRHDALHSFITPGTILRWHRDIVRRRWAAKSKPKRPERPPTHRHIVRLVLRMTADNEHWGLSADHRRTGRARSRGSWPCLSVTVSGSPTTGVSSLIQCRAWAAARSARVRADVQVSSVPGGGTGPAAASPRSRRPRPG